GLTISGTVHDNIEVTDVTIDLVGTAWSWKATLGAGTTDKTWSKTFGNIQSELGGYGDKTFKVTAYDKQGNSSYLIFTLAGDSTKPVVTVRSHTNNTSYGDNASFDLTGDATDNIKVTGVSIKWVEGNKTWTDAIVTGGDKSKVWSKTFNFVKDGANGLFLNSMADTEQYADKTFEITVKDNQNNESTTSIRLTGDKASPVITIDNAEGSNIGTDATFTLSGNVTDNREVVRLTIKADGISKVWDSTADAGMLSGPAKNKSWSKTFNILTDLGGYSNRSFEVTAYDKNGNSSVSRVNLKGDTTKPIVVEITSHANNAALPSSFTLNGTCSDNVEVTRIVVEHEGGSIWDSTADAGMLSGTGKNKTWSKPLTIADLGGTYTDKAFTVYAYDGQGNVNSARVTFIGDRVAPTVSIASHSNGAFVKSTGAGFILSGTATDKRQDMSINGVVTKVMVKTGAQDHTADFTAPNWSIASSKFTLTEESYTFEISAHDDLGNIKTERVYVTVDNSPPAVVFSSPADNAALNGSVVVNGTVSDNSSGVKALYISYFKNAPTLSNYDEESELEAHSTTNISDITTDWAGKNLFKITGFT
ncbi:MAG TPA: Ig-like domain-containing protein, partial [Spirochaetota bacterium]|nr:Ig-like domain-containing protein [Spirochaetota bacterium]